MADEKFVYKVRDVNGNWITACEVGLDIHTTVDAIIEKSYQLSSFEFSDALALGEMRYKRDTGLELRTISEEDEIYKEYLKEGALEWWLEHNFVIVGIEDSQETIDLAEKYLEVEPPEKVLHEAVEFTSSEQDYKTYLIVSEGGVLFEGRKKWKDETAPYGEDTSVVSEWLDFKLDEGFEGEVGFEVLYQSYNPVSDISVPLDLTLVGPGMGELLGEWGASDARLAAELNIAGMAKKDTSQLTRPLGLLSYHELNKLKADINKLHQELRIRVSIDEAEGILSFVPIPVIPSLLAMGAEWFFGTKDFSDIDLIQQGIGEGPKFLQFIDDVPSWVGKVGHAVTGLSIGIMALEYAYFKWASGYLTGLEKAVDIHLSKYESASESSELGEFEKWNEWENQLKWLVWRDSKFAISSWNRYGIMTDEIKAQIIRGFTDRKERGEANRKYDHYSKQNNYNALLLVNQELHELGRYTKDSPFEGWSKKSIEGKETEGFYENNYLDEVLYPYLGNPIRVLEFLRGWAYHSAKNYDSTPDIVDPNDVYEKADIMKKINQFLEELGGMNWYRWYQDLPFMPDVPDNIRWVEPWRSDAGNTGEFTVAAATSPGLGGLVWDRLVTAYPGMETHTSSLGSSIFPAQGHDGGVTYFRNRLGGISFGGGGARGGWDGAAAPGGYFLGGLKQLVGGQGKARGGFSPALDLTAYLLAPFKKLLAPQKPSVPGGKGSRFSELLFQIPQMLLTSISPAGPLIGAGQLAWDIFGGRPGAQQPQMPAPQIVHRFEKGAVQIHNQSIDKAKLGNLFVSFLKDYSRK